MSNIAPRLVTKVAERFKSEWVNSILRVYSPTQHHKLGGTLKAEINDIYPKLTEIFRDVFGDDTLVASPTLTAKDVSGWDSLRNIRLMLTIEKAYGVRFSASEIGKLQNVDDLVQLVQTKL